MAGPIPSLASGKSSSTAAAMMCAAEWRMVSSRSCAPASSSSLVAVRTSSESIAMRRRVAPSDDLELFERLAAVIAMEDRAAQRWAEGVLHGGVPRAAVRAGRLRHVQLQLLAVE